MHLPLTNIIIGNIFRLNAARRGGRRMDSTNKENRPVKDSLTGIKPPLICIPIMAENLDDLLCQAAGAAALGPDLIEWRADGFDWSCGTVELPRILDRLKRAVDNIPFVFTLRCKEEGGWRKIPGGLRHSLQRCALKTRLLDYLDVELSSGPGDIASLRELAGECGTGLILSYHCFDGTPKEDALIERIRQAKYLGADIAKVAVTANSRGDALRLLGVAHRVQSEGIGIPVSLMAMGKLGAFTRIVAGFFGSKIVYASGGVTTAPGQVSAEDLRCVWRVLYND